MSVEVKTKNGYVKIANNLFENIFIRDFTKRELEVVLLIVRLSYGFNKKYAIIDPKTYLCLVGIPRQNINRTLDSLIDKKVILSKGNNIYLINKYYDEWEVKINKYFDQDKINCLKALQFKNDVITTITEIDKNCNQDDYIEVITPITENDTEKLQDVIPTITQCNQNKKNDVITTITEIDKNCNQDDYIEVITPITENDTEKLQDVIPTITQCNQNKKNDVITTITDFQKSNHRDYTTVITPITKNENVSSPRLHSCPENIDSESDIATPKDIIKDNIKTCIKDIYIEGEEKKVTKNFDPYFNNPIVEKFKKEYEKIFDKKRCYLDNFQINKLIEISADNPDFIEKIPEILEKYRKIEFSNGISKFGLKGLINEGKWAGILNGEYDNYIKNKDSQNSSFDLGIPVWSDD